MNKLLLSFDLEEFDLPLEYNQEINKKEQYEFSYVGLKNLLNLLEKCNIKVTFFTTASFAQEYPLLIKQISEKHEIASHGLNHQIKEYNEKEVKESKEIIEKIINKEIKGFRFPRLKKLNKSELDSLKRLGFLYDSSICPSYIPGRYNHYLEKRNINLRRGIYEIPISTFPIIHLPLSWIYFRFFGITYSKLITKTCLKNPGFVNSYFHPWEFNDLSKFKIPFYIKRNSGKKALDLLEKYIIWCKKKNYEFITFSDALKNKYD